MVAPSRIYQLTSSTSDSVFTYQDGKMIDATRNTDRHSFDEQGRLIKTMAWDGDYEYIYNDDGTIKKTKSKNPNWWKIYNQYGNIIFSHIQSNSSSKASESTYDPQEDTYHNPSGKGITNTYDGEGNLIYAQHYHVAKVEYTVLFYDPENRHEKELETIWANIRMIYGEWMW